jgi:hypothetical protein
MASPFLHASLYDNYTPRGGVCQGISGFEYRPASKNRFKTDAQGYYQRVLSVFAQFRKVFSQSFC